MAPAAKNLNGVNVRNVRYVPDRTDLIDYAVPDFGGLWAPDLTVLPNGWAVAVATITPDLAAAMLKHNRGDNRRKRNKVHGRYGDDMRTGRWRLTHQGVAFDRAGNLCDGQHRLTACVESGSPFPTLVFFGTGDDEEMVVLDTGANRSVSDASTYLLGERVDTNTVALIRSFIYGVSAVRYPMTNSHVLAQVERYAPVIPFARAAFSGGKRLPAPCRAVVCRAYFHADRGDLIRFAGIAADHIDPSEPRDRAAKLLRRFIESASGGANMDRQREQYCKAQRAVAAYLSGENLEKLYAVSDDLFPLPTDEQIADRNQLEAEIAKTTATTE